jgi:hypothetical protein
MKIILALILVASLVSGTIYFVVKNSTNNIVFSDPTTGLSFNFDAELEPIELTQTDRDDKVVSRITSVEEGGNILITARYEDGFKKASGVTSKTSIDIILNSIERSYPERFPGYKELSSRKYDNNGKAAAEVIFSYNSTNDSLATQRLVVLTDGEDRAVYVSAQSLTADFETLNLKYFDTVFESVDI